MIGLFVDVTEMIVQNFCPIDLAQYKVTCLHANLIGCPIHIPSSFISDNRLQEFGKNTTCPKSDMVFYTLLKQRF